LTGAMTSTESVLLNINFNYFFPKEISNKFEKKIKKKTRELPMSNKVSQTE